MFWQIFLLNSKKPLAGSFQHVTTCPRPSSQLLPPPHTFSNKDSSIPGEDKLQGITHTIHFHSTVLRARTEESRCCVYTALNYGSLRNETGLELSSFPIRPQRKPVAHSSKLCICKENQLLSKTKTFSFEITREKHFQLLCIYDNIIPASNHG